MQRRRGERIRWSPVLILVAIALVATGCAPKYDAPFDFDGDGKADFIWTDLSTGQWFKTGINEPTVLYASMDPNLIYAPVPGDFDGDGRWEAAVVGHNGEWETQGDAGILTFPKPPAEGNQCPYQAILAVPAAYDGGNKTLPAWYRDSDATWFISGRDPIQFGSGPSSRVGCNATENMDQDIPVPADYDGDTKTDLATFNPRTGLWRIRNSRDETVRTLTLGGPQTYPVPADYDGVRYAQPAVYAWTGDWILEGSASPIRFGSGYDFPVPADYDGDRKADLAYVTNIFPSSSEARSWYVYRPSPGPPIPAPTILVPLHSRRGMPVELNNNLLVVTARITLMCKNSVPATC